MIEFTIRCVIDGGFLSPSDKDKLLLDLIALAKESTPETILAFKRISD